ncbi:MAG: hypothetical protein GY841_04770 [FCB group bacterium]|nr:hypothetical protein [FCB group bacterium]
MYNSCGWGDWSGDRDFTTEFCGDANGDGSLDIGDPVFLINYVFKSGPSQVEPCCP